MKIAVLEWVCGGGLSDDGLPEMESSLADEGRAMLCCLANGFAMAEHDVIIAADTRLTPPLREQLQKRVATRYVPPRTPASQVLNLWADVAGECDFAIVVAPECDGILLRALERLAKLPTRLLNCSEPVLSLACDKMRTAAAMEHHQILHPPTCRLDQVSDAWLANAQSSDQAMGGDAHWCVKPIDGAGCDSLSCVPGQKLSEHTRSIADPKRFIIQPWIDGASFSCSAIVNPDGIWHWMPLMTQEFSAGPRPKYEGGRLADLEHTSGRPDDVLTCIAAAFGAGAGGWVGVDLLWARASKRWYTVEVNSRCTTSLVALTAAYPGNLPAAILACQFAGFCGLRQDWRFAQFNVSGTRIRN